MSSSPNKNYEIEIKSLLGKQAAADELLARFEQLYPQAELVEESKQLNHYFSGSELVTLTQSLQPHLSESQYAQLKELSERAQSVSVRTRQLNDTILFIVKASIDDTTSENGISRQEFEVPTPDLSLKQLDELILDAGFSYQAKWSRQRRAFRVTHQEVPVVLSIDKNAGYGFLAEFETTVTDPAAADGAQSALRSLMKQLNAVELSQDRLERMFAHYNRHWQEYYGTDRTFVIE